MKIHQTYLKVHLKALITGDGLSAPDVRRVRELSAIIHSHLCHISKRNSDGQAKTKRVFRSHKVRNACFTMDRISIKYMENQIALKIREYFHI